MRAAPTPQEVFAVNTLIAKASPFGLTPVPTHPDASLVIYSETSGSVLCGYTLGATLAAHRSDLSICTLTSEEAFFQLLVSNWHKERGATSSITFMAMCPAYQRIIGIGPKAVRLILRQLEREGDNPDHWFWALRALTGADPVPPDSRGDMGEMARAWLDWAYLNGYEW